MSDRTLRPLALGDIFDEGFDLYKRNFLLFLLITAVWIVPLYVIRAVITAYFGHDIFTISQIYSDSSDGTDAVFRPLGQISLYFLIGPALMCVVWSALAAAACNRYLNRDVSLKSAYALPVRRLLPLIGAAVLTGIALGAGTLLCYIGVLWPLVVLVFTAHTFVLEKKSPWAALKRSNALVSGEGGRVISAVLLLLGFAALLSAGFGVLVNYGLGLLMHLIPGAGEATSGAVLGNGPVKRDQVLNDLAYGITQVVLLPFAASVLTVLYFDLRVRKEAYDIELAAEDLGYPPLDIGALSSNGYMPPVMPAPVMRPGAPQSAQAWNAPNQGPPPGWGTPNQGPPPGWGTPNQGPPPGWGTPNQGPPPGWGTPNQGPPPGWGPPNQNPPAGWAPPGQMPPGWGAQGQPPQPGNQPPPGWAPPGRAPAAGWAPPGQPAAPQSPGWVAPPQGIPGTPGPAPSSVPPAPDGSGSDQGGAA